MGAAAAVGSLVLGGVSAGSKMMGGFAAANAAEQEGQAALEIGKFNSAMFLRKGAQAELNASQADYLAKFSKNQAFYEADVNRKLGEIEWNWSQETMARERQAADASATYTEQRGAAEASILEQEAKRLGTWGTSNRARMAKENRAAEGAVTSSLAAGNVEQTGSALELKIETAAQGQLRLVDSFLQQHAQQQSLGYKADLARADSQFEADATRYTAELQIGDQAFKADASRYLTNFQAAQTETQGWISWANYKTEAANYKNEAFDNRMQAQYALYEGQVGYAAGQAKATAARWGAVSDFAGNMAGLGNSAYKMQRAGAFKLN